MARVSQEGLDFLNTVNRAWRSSSLFRYVVRERSILSAQHPQRQAVAELGNIRKPCSVVAL